MRKILFFLLLLVSSNSYCQDLPKTDTIFSGKYFYDRIENSKMNFLLSGLQSKCKTKVLNFDRSISMSDNLEYSILFILNGFDKFTKSTIFSDYKYFIYSNFCYQCDLFDNVTLIEFHYTEKSKVETFKKKIDVIINDKDYFNYPQDKLFYYKILDNNVCYLLISTKSNLNNEIFYELKNKIEKLQ